MKQRAQQQLIKTIETLAADVAAMAEGILYLTDQSLAQFHLATAICIQTRDGHLKGARQ